MKQLSKDIMEFLDKHAGVCPGYDPSVDDADEKYTSPDASELLMDAKLLAVGQKVPRVPFSDWGSGGYHPYSDKEVKAVHDGLVTRISKFVKEEG